MTFQPWQVFIWRNSGDATSPRFHKPTHKSSNIKYTTKQTNKKVVFEIKVIKKRCESSSFALDLLLHQNQSNMVWRNPNLMCLLGMFCHFIIHNFLFLLHIYVHINVFLCSLCENKHDDEGVHKRPLITFCLIFIVLNHFCSCFSTRVTSYRSCHQRVRLPRGTTDKTTKIRARL